MSTDKKQVKTVAELRQELAEAASAHKLGELKNTAQLRALRVEIARALTAERQAATTEKEEEK